VAHDKNNDVLIEAIRSDLIERDPMSETRIDTINFSKDFIVVRLQTGQIGFCLNYAFLSLEKSTILEAQKSWVRWLIQEPRQWNSVFEKAGSLPLLLRNGIHVALLSALSQLYVSLKTQENMPFLKGPRRTLKIKGHGRHKKLAQIGMGNKIEVTLARGNFEELHISDFHINNLPLAEYVSKLRSTFPKVKISTSDGSLNDELVKQSDLIEVTASTLTNSTLLPILQSAREWGTDVCLYGISGNLLPQVFFDYGVIAIDSLEVSPSRWQSVSDWLERQESHAIDSFYGSIPFCDFRMVPVSRDDPYPGYLK